MIVMGYDEHYAGSDIVGSVASMNFEINGIENMLTEVPKEKLVSAIPFYTRLWYTETLADTAAGDLRRCVLVLAYVRCPDRVPLLPAQDGHHRQ